PTSHATIGAPIPASRSCRASASVATPSQLAPPRNAARAAGTAPCPYPPALTTAITSPRATPPRSPPLCATASRSTTPPTRPAPPVPQLPRLRQRRHPPPAGPPPHRGPSRRHRPVPVPLRLDDRHHLAASHPPQLPHVVRDRIKIHDRLDPPHPPSLLASHLP